MIKTEFLQIRLSPQDRKRVHAVADANYLDASTWARTVIMQAVDDWENRKHPSGRNKNRHRAGPGS
jgi:hypothetical protein